MGDLKKSIQILDYLFRELLEMDADYLAVPPTGFFDVTRFFMQV